MEDIRKIILGTGSYSTVKSGNTVSITGDGGNAWGYFGPSYKALAPKLVTYLPYAEKYELLKELEETIRDYLIHNKNVNKKYVKEYQKFRKEIEDEYIRSFYEIRLKDLDVYELLYKLEKWFGHDIILLCHETIEEFCHRRLVADYIELKTGIFIPEVEVDEKGFVKKRNPIRYKNRLIDTINKV